MPTIYEQGDAFRAAVAAYEQGSADELTSRYQVVLDTLKPLAESLAAQIADARTSGETVNLSWLMRQARYKTLVTQTEAEIARFAIGVDRTITSAQAGAVERAQAHTESLIQASGAKVSGAFNRLPTGAFENIVGSLGDGSPLKTLLDQLSKQGGKEVGDALAKAVALGWNPRKTAREVETAAGIPRDRALTISRTETLRAYRQAAIQSYQANGEAVSGWRWLAALSGRSCAMCIAMHGTIHPVSEPFGSHVCCRCCPSPVVTEADGAEFETGVEWFEKQSDKTQDTVLGSAKAGDAYRSGQVALADFIGEKKSDQWGLTRFATSFKTAASNASFSGDASEKERTTPAKRLTGVVAKFPYRSLASAEARIAKEPVDEFSAFFGRDGKLLEAYQGAGARINYQFSEREISRLKHSVHTHNHPGTDASFSLPDVHLACVLQLSELRAVTPNYVYVMQPGAFRWSIEAYDETIVPAFDAADTAVQQSDLSALESLAEYDHLVWQEVAAKLGLRYYRKEQKR